MYVWLVTPVYFVGELYTELLLLIHHVNIPQHATGTPSPAPAPMTSLLHNDDTTQAHCDPQPSETGQGYIREHRENSFYICM